MYTISFFEQGKPFTLTNLCKAHLTNLLNTLFKGSIEGTFQVSHLTITKHS